LLAAALLFFMSNQAGEARSIRLRKEVIDTDSGGNRAEMAAAMRAKVAANVSLRLNGESNSHKS
jgi:hypothetical protein